MQISGPTKIDRNDIVSIGSYKCSKNDILNAIKKYDFNNKDKQTQNVHLQSSINTSSGLKIFKNIKLTKNIYIGFFLLILILIFTFFFFKFINNQKLLESKFLNSDATELKVTNDDTDQVKEKKRKPIRKQKSDVTYDFSCFDQRNQSESEEFITTIGQITRNIQNDALSDVQISLNEEIEYGNEILKSFQDRYDFIENGRKIQKLRLIKNDLVSRILNPRGFSYKIFLVNDTIKNVFTAGGNIYFFNGMYSTLKNDSEIASIIAHEISHNELAHMTLKLKKIKSVSEYGIFGNLILNLENFFTESFDQKQEIEADLFGMDLVYPTRYKNCSAFDFWNRNKDVNDNIYSADDFFRSHPFSNNRAECISNHLITNYNINCN
tara:strand:- start:390 stop:1529 length:1140 start_codon:yes stop_codon:yes gene_type:complete